MKIVAGILLLIAGVLAYPVAESDIKNSEVPLVVTDYSSVAKAEDQLVVAAAHGEVGHVHDSEESSSSESAETENTKDDNKQEKSTESSEEGVMQDGIPAVTLNSNEPKKEIKAEAKELPKPIESSLITGAAKEIKEILPEEPKKDESTKLEKKEVEKKNEIPALKSSPVEESSKIPEKSDKVPESLPSGKSAEVVADVKAEEQAPTDIEKPLALPALKNDLPAEPAKIDNVLPSEQKVEVSPAAEEVLPQLKSTENLNLKPEFPITEKNLEQKENLSQKKIEGSVEKPEEKKVEEIKEFEKKVEEITQDKVEKTKPVDIPEPVVIPETKLNEKKAAEVPEVKHEHIAPIPKSLPNSEEKKVEKILPAQAVTTPSDPKPSEKIEEKTADLPKGEPKPEEAEPKVAEPTVIAKSIQESKPEEKKTDEVTTEKISLTSASSS